MAVGACLSWIAAVHLGVGVVLYLRELEAILREGVVASVGDFGDRAAAFWFLVVGVALLVFGLSLRELESQGARLPAALAPGLLALAAVLVIPMPASGGWLFLPVAWLAWHRRRSYS